MGNEFDEMQLRSIELGSHNMTMAVVNSGLKEESLLYSILTNSKLFLNRKTIRYRQAVVSL